MTPDVVIIDDWTYSETLRCCAKNNNCVLWVGKTTEEHLERMLMLSDIRYFGAIERDAAFIMGLYGNQASILKNRFGRNGVTGINQKHIQLTIE